MIRYLLSFVGGFLLFQSAGFARPNFVFILADDLGYGDLGCYGAPDIKTPHLDRLAGEGVKFTNAYANGPVCSPTRMAFLTGRYQQRYGMDNALYYQEFGRGLPPGGETIATRLKRAGYVTGLSGKWHVGYDVERQPNRQGFDHFFGLLGGNHHYFEHMDRIGVPDLWLNENPIEREGYSTDLITDDAIAFLEKSKDQPFFLYLSHVAPHFPWQGPDDADKDIQPKKKSWQTGDRETYIKMVESMDQGIGRVLDRLDELGLADDTLVVFTSDNGGSTYSRNDPFRGSKSTLWEGGIRVPCLARWPGVFPAGETTDQLSMTMDWTATFAELAGEGAIRETDEGINLAPILEGTAKIQTRTLFWRQKPGPKRKSVKPAQAVRHGKWKWFASEEEGSFLFDLEKDPSESTNLVGDHPEVVGDLRKRHGTWVAEVDGP
jgi:N-acetylgalactosamine-6-sulfatase